MPRCFLQHSLSLLTLSSFAASSFAVLGLAGCGAITSPGTPQSIAASRLAGKVMGGQQPIAGSTVTVWQVGDTDYGSAATQLAQTTSAADGTFAVTAGSYSCLTPTTQVYITAQGGDATPGFNNPAILLAAGLGDCSTALSQVVNINEVTTVVTAYALGQFLTYPLPSTDSFGTPPADLGYLTLANTATIPLLVNLPTGTVNPNTATVTIEAAKIYSIANTLAACVNSTAADTSTCSTLFADTADTDNGTPANTLEATEQMAFDPYQNVTALYDLGQPQAPFVGLSQAPNDWSVAVAYTTPTMGLGIAPTPTSATSSTIDIDATGRVWFPSDLPGSTGIGYFDPATATFSGPFITGVFTQPQYVAIDSGGLAWATDQASPTIGYADTTAPATNTLSTAQPGFLYLGPMTADQDGDLFFTYIDSSSVPNLGFANIGSSSGEPLGAFIHFPTGMVAPSFGVFAATSGLATPCAGEEMSSGSVPFTDFIGIATTSNCASGGAALAVDDSDGLIVATSLNQICSVTSGCFTPAPLNLPEGLATDGYGDEWVANSGNASVTVFGSFDDPTSYDQISPVAYLHNATNGATMTAPYGIAIDGSGNVWVSNASCVSTTTTPCTPTSFQLTELIGAAGPTTLWAQDGGSLTGTAPELAGHPAALSHRRRPMSLSPHLASSTSPFGHAQPNSKNSQWRSQLRTQGVPWLTRKGGL